MRNSLTLILTSVVLALSAATAVTAATPEYRVTVVGPAGSSAWDINSSGVVVGSYPSGTELTRAFLGRGRGRGWVDLGTLGGTASRAVSINDRGEVLGNWRTGGGQWRGFIWHRGRARDIGIIGGTSTYYSGINDAGYIAARSPGPDEGALRSYLRAPNGRVWDIGSLPFDPPITEALGLNNRNQIAGGSGLFALPADIQYHAFIWTRGVMRDLGGLGTTPNVAFAINDRGQATGFASVPGGFRERKAFLYSRGRLIDIDGRPLSESPESTGYGINNRGHVVGNADRLFAFVYRGRRMQSLTALVDPAWRIDEARAINDAGQIAATGIRNGRYYAVRLDLIRPSAEAAPLMEPDPELDAEAPLLNAPLSPAQAAAEARLDAEAQAREVAQPVER